MLTRWLVYGSPSSVDCDVFVPITLEHAQHLGKKAHHFVDLCTLFQKELLQRKAISTYKKLSVNVGIMDDTNGVVAWSLKGGADETNNVIFHQYAHHAHLQAHPLFIRALLPCNIPCRIMHTLRSTLGMLTRTQYRDVCKAALKCNTVSSRCDALRSVRLEDVRFSHNAKITPVDCFKTIAYKVGHVYALLLGLGEQCSKEDVAHVFPQLEPFLMRASLEVTVPLLPQLTTALQDFVACVVDLAAHTPDLAETQEEVVWWAEATK